MAITAYLLHLFTSNNKPILEIATQEACFGTGGKWINSDKTETNYDGNNNKTDLKQYIWRNDSARWDLYPSVYYNYNSNNKIISEIDSFLLDPNWSIKKRVYSYDNIGYITSNTILNWENGNWENEEKYEFSYDLAKKTIESVNSVWFGGWDISDKTVFQTDINGETIVSTCYGWRGYWEPYLRYLIDYNESFKIEEIAWPHVSSFGNISSKYQLLTYKIEEFVNNKWKNSGLETFYYSSLIAETGINELTNPNINFYPNPSNGMININTNEAIENINITDVNGKLVHHQTNNSPIDLSQNPNGIYFVNITTEKGVINKKVMLNK